MKLLLPEFAGREGGGLGRRRSRQRYANRFCRRSRVEEAFRDQHLAIWLDAGFGFTDRLTLHRLYFRAGEKGARVLLATYRSRGFATIFPLRRSALCFSEG